jgi:putative oxidoreductase
MNGRAMNIGLWALQVPAAAAFLIAGFAKLTGQPMMVENFEKVGVGQWFRYLTGAIEIASAILLVIPRLTAVGAALLVCTMTGAVLAQVLALGGSPVPALVLGCFAALILWGRFQAVKAWLGRPSRRAGPAAEVYGV